MALNNRILSGLVFMLRSLIGRTVKSKLSKGVETVNRLGHLMGKHPGPVQRSPTDYPALPEDDVAFVRQQLESLSYPGGATPSRKTAP